MTVTDAPPGLRAAYSGLAPHYDAFTDHPAYRGWILSLERLARAHGCAGRSVLDLGCGTGKSLEPVTGLGYRAHGVEPVREMRALAARRLGSRARLTATAPAAGSFDLVTAVNDVVNCALTATELHALLAAAARNLAPGGVLLFDANTALTYSSMFSSAIARNGIAWSGLGVDAGGIATAEVRAGERLLGVHRQRLWPDAAIRAALHAAGLRVLSVHGQDELGRRSVLVDERRHPKRIYVATRT